jgi:AraC-like DNA-binding protein
MDIQEYSIGHGLLADKLGCKRGDYDVGIRYVLPPGHGDSWIIDVYPAPGLCVGNAYFTLHEPVTCSYEFSEPGLWMYSFDYGDIRILERGKRRRKLQQGMHTIVSQGDPVEVILGSGDFRYTSIWICAGFIEKYLEYRTFKQPFAIMDALDWQSRHYSTPELLMVWEQLKYGIRNAVAPLMYFESKVIELLALIIRNTTYEWYGTRFIKTERPKHLTYNNRKYLLRVKDALDQNIADPPDITQLARIAEMGTTKLRMVFKSSYGMTITSYVRQEKMNYAMRMLSDDALSIQHIGDYLGYESPSKFTVAFKKVHGFTPSQFRKSFGLYCH